MEVHSILIREHTTIVDAVATIDACRKGVAIIVDEEKRFLGIVTDGDIRRAVLARVDMNQPVKALLERRSKQLYPNPISAPRSMDNAERLALMYRYKIRHLPIVDENNVVVDLVLLDDLLKTTSIGFTAVVMAGGAGKRLRPLTEDLPKPMLHLDGKPLLERLIGQLREAGIQQVQVTTHYKPERIIDYFGDGSAFGVRINYINEEQPLGTAGALALLASPSEPLLVINGDILTSVDFKVLFAFHQEHNAEMTVAVREYTMEIPYGVIETNDDMQITRVVEKPTAQYFINAGIYLINPTALSFIPHSEKYFDMPSLINVLVEHHRSVVSFPIREYWLDIGQMEEYKRAQKDVTDGRL